MQVSHLVAQRLAIMAESAAAEQQLASAAEEHDRITARLAAALSALQGRCTEQQSKLSGMAEAAVALEAEEADLIKAGLGLNGPPPGRGEGIR